MRDRFLAVCGEMMASLVLMYELRLNSSTLTLLYAAIDTLAFYGMPKFNETGMKRASVNRSDFLGWVEKYLLPGSGLPCTAMDIYAARCGWVHNRGFDSDLVRQRKAKMLFYAWGTANVWEVNKAIILSGRAAEAVAVPMDSLLRMLVAGAMRFVDDVLADPERRELIQARLAYGPTHIRQDWTTSFTGPQKHDSLLHELSDAGAIAAADKARIVYHGFVDSGGR